MLELISDLSPPCCERTWMSAPHPRLPLVATCSAEKSVRVYSLVDYTLLSTISGGHKRSVRSCAWKPHCDKESILATGSFDATVGVWSRPDSYGSAERSAIFAEEIDVTNGQKEGEEDEEEEWRFAVLLDGHESEVKSVAWSSSGSLLATCSRDKSIWIWEDLEDGDNNFETVAVLQEHGGDVKCVAWHPTEECLASGSYDDTIRLWREDVDDWGQIACLKGHKGTVWSLDWEAAKQDEPDGHSAVHRPRLVSGSDDRTVRVWKNVSQHAPTQATSSVPSIIRPAGIDETWEEEAQLPKMHELPIYSVVWSKKTGLVASAGGDGRIVVYQERSNPSSIPSSEDSTTQGSEWAVLTYIEGAHGVYEVNHVAWANRAEKTAHSEEEEVLISTGDDGSVKVWHISA